MEFFVHGKPVPKGSTHAFAHKTTGRVVTLQNNRAALYDWQGRIAMYAQRAGVELSHEAVFLTLVFCLPRPRFHFTANLSLRATAPAEHIKKPDIDKLIRAVLDALTGVAWADDNQVVSLHVQKKYCRESEAGVYILIKNKP